MKNFPKQKIIIVIFFLLLTIILIKKVDFKKNKISLRPKNIVLINLDTLRADHMGIYGYKKKTTPFLDTLSAGGVIFNQAIVPSYLTFQTDAAILSGLYPSQNNVMTWDTPIKDNVELLPGILKKNNYVTAAFVSPSLWKYFGFDKQFDSYQIAKKKKNISESRVQVTKWLGDQKKPFFLFWHIYDIHLPFIDPAKDFYSKKPTLPDSFVIYEKQERNILYPRPKNYLLTAGKIGYEDDLLGQAYSIKKDDIEYLEAAYDSGIKYVDDQLRLFFQSIQDKPYYKDTLFIISSEHGEDLGEHGFIFHRDLYDVNIRVPLVFIYPSFKPLRIKQPVSLLDIMPTVLRMVNIPVPKNIEGKDISELFTGKLRADDRDIFSERPPFDEYSIRRGRWKYILRNPAKKGLSLSGNLDFFSKSILFGDDTFSDELYDLLHDPGEKNNLVGRGYKEENALFQAASKFRDKERQARETNKKTTPINRELLMPYF